MRKRISITQQHISDGGGDTDNDAIFLALSEHFDPGEFPYKFTVGHSFLWLDSDKYAISDELVAWINDSDEGRPIKPITIEIDDEAMTVTIAKEGQ